MIMKNDLIKLWKTYTTKRLAEVFKQYATETLSAKPLVYGRKDNANTYMIDGKSTGWNRVSCYYHKDSSKYGDEDLCIVLRKKAGDYLIIGRKGIRTFEIDYSGTRHYDEKMLNEIIADHKPLFEMLLGKNIEL
jgi:hypothetical protein